MVQLIAIPAVLIALYALWVVGRTDLLRLTQGVRRVRARVVRHVSGSDGFTPIFAFQHGERSFEIPGQTAYAKPTPEAGSNVVLTYPAKRPDLAREPHPLARGLMYALFAAWIAFFSDLWLGWA